MTRITGILLLICSFSFAGKIDSLENVLLQQGPDTHRILTLNRLCREYIYKDLEKALHYGSEAATLSEKLKYNRGLSRAYNSLGIIYRNKADYENAVKFLMDAIRIAEETGDKKQIAGSYTNLGIIYKNQANYNRALEYHELSKKTYLAIGDTAGAWNCDYNMAIVYRLQKQYDKALNLLVENLAFNKRMNDETGVVGCLIAIGNVFMETRDFAKAIEYYKEADLAVLSGKKMEEGKRSIILMNLGTAYFELGLYRESVNYSERAIVFAEKSGQVENVRDCLKNLAYSWEKLGDSKKAFAYLNRMHQVHDSISRQKASEVAQELQNKYDSEKKRKEIEILTMDNENLELQRSKDRTILIISVGALLLVLGGAVVLGRALVQNRKFSSELFVKNAVIEEKNKDILDSIRYAKRLQTSILPSHDAMKKSLGDHFVFYKPKDIVSGDYYCVFEQRDKTITAIVDCTGHGVPGAFMSILTFNILHQVIMEDRVTKPSDILDLCTRLLPMRLRQQGDAMGSDGMDIAIAAFDRNKTIVEFAGAFNPLWIIRDGTVKELQADKISIGSENALAGSFTPQSLTLQKGDSIYLFSDGYADQFGGEKGKKLMTRNFRNLLLNIAGLPMESQRERLESSLLDWQGAHEQVDDILVVGIRV
ncbi:MAG: tetratricopeptide repeat protein [Bacteroidia bacterium]|nr:tetratricopeptide repeat protein [Bacteroidia bacterium]